MRVSDILGFFFPALVKATKNFHHEINFHPNSLSLPIRVSYKANMLRILCQEKDFISVLHFKTHSIKANTL